MLELSPLLSITSMWISKLTNIYPSEGFIWRKIHLPQINLFFSSVLIKASSGSSHHSCFGRFCHHPSCQIWLYSTLKVIAEIRGCSSICYDKTRQGRKKKKGSQAIRQVVNSLGRLCEALYLEIKLKVSTLKMLVIIPHCIRKLHTHIYGK